MWRATLKSLFARKVRMVLTALSVVFGVGFVAGTFVLTDTMNKAFDELFTQATSGIDVIVRSSSAFTAEPTGPGGGGGEQREPFPETVLPLVERVEGVAAASGDVSGYAQIVDPATGDPIGGLGPPTIGLNWTDTNSAIVLREGSAPSGPDQVVVDAGTASKYHLRVGQTIRIIFQDSVGEFTISGIAGFGTADNLAGATLALFDLSTAQDVLGKPGRFDQIDVVADDGVDPADLRARVADVLPKGLESVTGTTVADEQSKELQEGLGFFRTVLLVFAFIALFVGAFLIFNTFSIIVAQRTKELALLRAIGASRRQVMASVVAESFVTGVLASVLGIAAGIGIAVGLQALLSAFGIDLPSTSTQLKLRTIVVSLIVGTVVTVISSVMPARRASLVAPIEALRESQETMVSAGLGRRLTTGLAVAGAGAASLLYGLFGNPSNGGAIVGMGAALSFVGVAILSPLVARPLAGVIGWPIRRLGIQGKLGRENAMRNPRRTASTASALMIGLGLVAMVSILSASLKSSFTAVLNDTLKADFTLTTSSFSAFSPHVAQEVDQVPGVATVAEFRQGGFRVNGSNAAVTGVDPAAIEQVAELDVIEGSTTSLAQGQIMVSSNVAEPNGWKVGDTVNTAFATTGDTPLTIGGIYDRNQIAGDYLISLSTYEKYFTEQLDTFVMVKLAPGADPAAAQRDLESATKSFGNIEVQDQAAFREKQAGFIDQLLGLVSALLLMAILIALIGIANTLGLSVLERRHELGLLRAVGMSRTQVKRMIRWESVIIAIMGAVLGIAVGFLFGWALQQSLASDGVTELTIPVGQLIVYVVLAGLAGVLAAIWPARRAAKLNVLESIAFE